MTTSHSQGQHVLTAPPGAVSAHGPAGPPPREPVDLTFIAPGPPSPPPPSFTVIHLGEGTDQSAPVWLTSPAPPYPPEALAAKVSGMVLARCNAYPDGGLRDCKILKSHSFFDAAVLAHLARAKIKPFTSGGKPVNGIVALNIPIRFTLPP